MKKRVKLGPNTYYLHSEIDNIIISNTICQKKWTYVKIHEYHLKRLLIPIYEAKQYFLGAQVKSNMCICIWRNLTKYVKRVTKLYAKYSRDLS